MFQKSDYFIILAVAISFVISAYLWFVLEDREQAIFTAIWGSLDIHLRHLLQALCADGEEKMTFDLFFPAIIVFVLMLIGVVLTVHEFNKLEKKERETRSDKRGGHDREKKR